MGSEELWSFMSQLRKIQREAKGAWQPTVHGVAQSQTQLRT